MDQTPIHDAEVIMNDDVWPPAESERQFPFALLSKSLRSCPEIQWCLLYSTIVLSPPRWARKSGVHRGFFFFRKVAYLDRWGSVLGLGSVWLPIGGAGLRLFMKSYWIFGARRLIGDSIARIYSDQYDVVVVLSRQEKGVLSPFCLAEDSIHHYRRLIHRRLRQGQSGRLLACVEEHLTDGLLEILSCDEQRA